MGLHGVLQAPHTFIRSLHEKDYGCWELKPVFYPVIIHCTDWTITANNNNSSSSKGKIAHLLN
jgi:hypothetical protein